MKVSSRGLISLYALGVAQQEQQKYAEEQQAKAEEVARQAERISRSNLNALTALQLANVKLARPNPTQALRLAEMNYHLYPESETALGILFELYNASEAVYKTIKKGARNYNGGPLVFSPNGNQFLIATYYGAALLLNLEGDTLQTFESYTDAIAFAPSGENILTANQDSITLWDLDGNPLRKFFNPNFDQSVLNYRDYSPSLAFAPDGKCFLATSGSRITLWDLNKDTLKTINTFSKFICAAAFAPDSSYFMAAGFDGTIKVIDFEGNVKKSFNGGYVLDATFSPDGKSILATNWYSAVLYDLEGNILQTFTGGHSFPVNTLAFSPDGKRILTGSRDNTSKLWDLKGRELKSLIGHTDWVNAVAFSPDGKTIITGSRNGLIKRWDVEGGNQQAYKVKIGDLGPSLFLPDGKHVLLASGNKTYLWNFESGQLITLDETGGGARSLAAAAQSDRVMTAISDGKITIWNLEGDSIKRIENPISVEGSALAPDGQSFLIGNRRESPGLLLNLDGDTIQTFQGKSLGAKPVMAFAPDGTSFFSACGDDCIGTLCDLYGDTLRTFKNRHRFNNMITCAAFSPDGKWLLTGANGGGITLWDLQSNDFMAFKRLQYEVGSVAFSPDGKGILSASVNRVYLWDLNGKQLQTFQAPIDEAFWAAFSPDGKYLFFAGPDQDVYGQIMILKTPVIWNYLKENVDTFPLESLKKAGLQYTEDDLKLLQKNGKQW